MPDLPRPQRITVDAGQVRRLVAAQFPGWAHLPVRPVARGGWDNFTFHLGDTLVARLPSAAEYALAVEKERTWLPRLAARLPLPVPVPLAAGRPGAGYPFAWSSTGGFPANRRGFPVPSPSPATWPGSWLRCRASTRPTARSRGSTTGSGAAA